MQGARFQLGRITATPGACELPPEFLVSCLGRHVSGDWGSLDAEDVEANNAAIAGGVRILSVYEIPGGGQLWIITEADRSVTTFLLPDEY